MTAARIVRVAAREGIASVRIVNPTQGCTWVDLDQLLRWNVRREPDLPSRLVFEYIDVNERTWEVSKRGTRRSGNMDPLAVISNDRQIQVVEALKDLAADISAKAVFDRNWMKSEFMPALVAAVCLEELPALSHTNPVPSELPGYPAEVLLHALQVLAFSEFLEVQAT
jgi:hypothetical protein